ncbi:unnamed protein product, partial [Ectocarpus sp. 12 AP-2014]
ASTCPPLRAFAPLCCAAAPVAAPAPAPAAAGGDNSRQILVRCRFITRVICSGVWWYQSFCPFSYKARQPSACKVEKIGDAAKRWIVDEMAARSTRQWGP